MSKQKIEEIVNYLTTLAPSFFLEKMQGASDREISNLEKTANRVFCGSYFAFLKKLGNTQAGMLDPFLYGRDFHINTIKSNYQELHAAEDEEGPSLPDSIIYFSSTEHSGEEIFLRQPLDPDGDPEIGYFHWETGEFKLHPNKTFENWMFESAFDFRLDQLDFMLEFKAPWNEKSQVWEGQPSRYLEIMNSLGFQVKFEFPNGFVCHEREDIAISTHIESTSGCIASNNEAELKKVINILAYQLEIEPYIVPDRYYAPKE